MWFILNFFSEKHIKLDFLSERLNLYDKNYKIDILWENTGRFMFENFNYWEICLYKKCHLLYKKYVLSLQLINNIEDENVYMSRVDVLFEVLFKIYEWHLLVEWNNKKISENTFFKEAIARIKFRN